jgi:hypothetical protein
MRKTATLRFVNPLLLTAVLVQVVTGVGMWLFEWDAVRGVHIASAMILVVLAATHLTLNWPWVREAYRRQAKVSDPRT